MLRSLSALMLATQVFATPAVGAAGALNDREKQLMGIAASCAAFYQAAFFSLDLPVEGNEAKRQVYLSVYETLARREKTPKEFDEDFQRDVMARVIEVTTIIEQNPEVARPKVLSNLPKCDAFIPEMKRAAGLD